MDEKRARGKERDSAIHLFKTSSFRSYDWSTLQIIATAHGTEEPSFVYVKWMKLWLDCSYLIKLIEFEGAGMQQWVALWYKHGEPVFGRAYPDSAGKVKEIPFIQMLITLHIMLLMRTYVLKRKLRSTLIFFPFLISFRF